MYFQIVEIDISHPVFGPGGPKSAILAIFRQNRPFLDPFSGPSFLGVLEGGSQDLPGSAKGLSKNQGLCMLKWNSLFRVRSPSDRIGGSRTQNRPQKRPKMAKNGQKWPKFAKNCKILRKFHKKSRFFHDFFMKISVRERSSEINFWTLENKPRY